MIYILQFLQKTIHYIGKFLGLTFMLIGSVIIYNTLDILWNNGLNGLLTGRVPSLLLGLAGSIFIWIGWTIIFARTSKNLKITLIFLAASLVVAFIYFAMRIIG